MVGQRRISARQARRGWTTGQAPGATRWTTVQAIVLALTAGGCRKQAPEAAGSGAAEVAPITLAIAVEVEDTPLDDKPTLAALGDAAARRAALAGSYVVSGDEGSRGSSDYTPPLALTIPATGDTVTIWNGRAETTARLQLDSPCEFVLMTKHHDADTGLDGEEGPIYHWRVHDGVAEVGRNDLGVRVGEGALVCADHGVLIIDAHGRCMRHPSYGRTLEAARCGFRQDGGKDVFYYYSEARFAGEPAAKEVVLAVDDWRIGTAAVLDDDQPRPWFRRYADQAEARAVVDADARANDPLFIAQAAGGVVGDRTTVPGLVATFAADEKSLTGTVRVSGVVVRRRFGDDDPAAEPPPEAPAEDEPARPSERVDWLRLADGAHRDKPTITCDLAAAIVRIPDGTPITVEGTVEPGDEAWTKRAFAAPSLKDCRVVTP